MEEEQNPRLLNNLKRAALAILEQHPDGIKEYDLIKKLRKNDPSILPDPEYSDSYTTFRIHFILYHGLYNLRQQLCEQKRGILRIELVNIQLLPFEHKQSSKISENDQLSSYYLDISNLDKTSAQDVDEMLASFWQKYAAFDQQEQALEILGLKHPVDFQTIKKSFKRMTMIHHPDRGGKKEKFQEINAAMSVLTRYYL